jgi:DNA primase
MIFQKNIRLFALNNIIIFNIFNLMIIAQDKIDEIRNANDIVDVISSYISLNKKGKNYLARCPFHNEKTPSFNVSPDKQMFYCFGCQVGGNVFSFLQQYEKISFVDSVKKLADRAGISLILKSEPDEKDLERESLFFLNQTIAEYFHKNLLENPAGKVGLEYLLKRDISEETIKKFQLGLSNNSWEALVEFARARKLNFQNLENLGLIIKKDDGSYFDNFRGRVMFPIFSLNAKIAGFGGRKLFEDDNSGKYINSKESLVYNKSRILYGLFQTKEEIRKNEAAILVEGYMDFLTLYQGGFRNVIATSGTSLTVDQIKILTRYTKDILFLYDADIAGVKATLRGLDLLLENGLNVKIVELPEGEDPDSFLKNYGIDRLKNAITNSVSFIEFISRVYSKLGKLSSTKGLTDSTREMVNFITKVKDNLKVEFYLKEIAEKFNIYESTIRDEYEKILKTTKKRQALYDKGESLKVEKVPEQVQRKFDIIYPTPEEEDLIALIIMEGKRILDFVDENISDNEIISPITKNSLKFFNEIFKSGENLSFEEILNRLDDENLKGIITGLIFKKKIISPEELKMRYKNIEVDPVRWIKDVVKRIKIKRIDSELNNIKRAIKQAESQQQDYSDLILKFTELNETKMNWIKVE